MASSIEAQIKHQFAKIFSSKEWIVFKLLSEHYLRTATELRKRDIDISENYQLLARNAQKRLFIGIGCELLVKAFFLKQGYGINKFAPQQRRKRSFAQLYKINDVRPDLLVADETISFNKTLDYLRKIPPMVNITQQEYQQIMRGFKIAKVFRNKEGHVATLWHTFDPTNYTDIEKALVLFYRIGFNELLKIRFSVERNEPHCFEISPLPNNEA